jgi:hypothetical protein
VFAEFRRGVRDAAEDARVVFHRRLFLDRWEAWTLPAAIRLADGLAADRTRMHELLADEVPKHVAELQRDLAV